jgi:RNA polymerase sigma-70 factor (ECF subfamily)
VSEPTDEELFAAYRAGDDAAFDQLVARYAPVLGRMMRRDIRRHQDADELVQDTFLHLHRAAADFREGARLRPWLVTIALNLKREYLRRQGRKPEAPLDLDGRRDPVAPAARVAETHDARRQVDLAMAGLTDTQREVIELHWFAGLSFPEVAAAVGASLSAVKVRAHRGYERMRAALAAGGNRD